MKARKIFKVSAVLIIAIFIVLVSAPFLLQKKVAGIILNSLNQNLLTKLDVGSFKLSFLHKFPKASLDLKNVLVHSSPGFDSKQFSESNTDTLLFARFVSMEFSITDIINGKYDIERISAKTGQAYFYTDTTGGDNFNISAGKGNPNDVFTINLERINLTNIKAHYNNLAIKLRIDGFINNGKLKSKISGDNVDFIAVSAMDINYFQLFNTSISRPVAVGLNLILQSSKSGFLFKKCILSLQNNQVGLEGLVSHDNTLDLSISAHNIDIAALRNYLPDNYIKLFSNYNPKGSIIADCKIKGPLNKTSSPHIEINYRLNNGHITTGKSGIHNISFTGHLSNGLKNSIASSVVSFNNVKARLGSSEYTGSVSISDFSRPKTDITLKGRVYTGEMKEFFNIKKLSTSNGSVDVDLKLHTAFWPKDSITLNDVINLKPEANLVFNSFAIGLNNNQKVEDVNGKIMLSDIIKTTSLSFIYKGQRIKVDGEFKNLPEWLTGRPVKLIAMADVSFNRLIPEAFMKTTSSAKQKTSSFTFPSDLILDINFNIDSLKYKTFSSSKIAGALNYKPLMLTFKSLNMNSLNGSIEGSGLIMQNSNNSLIAKGNFKVSTIDVKKTFSTFHNFGQDFIKAENLSGNLSGTLSILLPMDSLLNVQVKSVTAEGKYILVNGALTNFEPVKHLSSYIELSELENIHFEKLENDFFIRKNILYVPQMDVRSSAADLAINGKHSFENNYEYHVKILLSEILSRKRRKNKATVTEFGIVEDDGLGRTSMLLKVVGKGEDIKVGYDLKAASGEIKNNIKTERQNLKSILNEEYGLYKGDTTVKKKPAEKKSRVRITWDGIDSSKTADPPDSSKESTIKKIFKKK
jgi:hypothetical protein